MSDLIANYLLCESRERGEVLTNLKLQKLLFYADAWHMVLHENELCNEQFEAWVHGPVLPSQYHRFKEFKWRPITAEIDCPDLNPEVIEHLNEILDVFGSETAVALELMTHRERPWLEARGDLAAHENSSAKISKATTRAFYTELQEKAAA